MPGSSFNRRELLSATAATGLVAATGVTRASDSSSGRVPGLQLYTVRDSMATDVRTTLQAVAGIGYREVEFAGYFGHSPGEIRGMLEELGLTSPSTHVGTDVLRGDVSAVVESAAEIGHRYVTLAWLAADERQSIDDYKYWAERVNVLGEACKSNGMRAAYHNHDFEFQAIDGIVPFDVLMEETESALVDFELDFFWVRKADMEIRSVLSSAPERFTLSHIKDIDDAGNMVNVGDGTIDFDSILDDAVGASVRHCFVEHDNPDDPFRAIAYSHFSLKNILK